MADWPVARLAAVAELNPALQETLSAETKVSFVAMAAASAATADTNDGEERPYREVAKGYTPFLAGDVLVAKITPCFENGKIVQATIHHRIGFGSTEFHVVRPRSGQADARYLLHFLRQERIRLEGERKMTGSAGQRRVPEHFLANLEVPLPPLPEQRRIAAILDKADELRVMRRTALEQLNGLTQAMFLEMFGDPVASSAKPRSVPLGDLLRFVTSGGRGWAAFYSPSGQRFIRSLDVQMNRISDDEPAFVRPPDNAEARRTRVEAGDVLLTITGSRIGRVAPVPDRLSGAYISQHVAILRPYLTTITADFLAFFLSGRGQRQIAKAQYGQTKPGLNFEQIKNFVVPLPSVAAQNEFGRRLAFVEKLKTRYTSSTAALDALFSSVQARAFSGAL